MKFLPLECNLSKLILASLHLRLQYSHLKERISAEMWRFSVSIVILRGKFHAWKIWRNFPGSLHLGLQPWTSIFQFHRTKSRIRFDNIFKFISLLSALWAYACVYTRSIIIINDLWTMFLCIEFYFDGMSREIWGSKSNFQMWNIPKPIAAEIKATMAAMT